MSESLTELGPKTERRYDEQSDRLFLIYYALPPGFNANKWGVSPTSIDANIQTAVNKPVVVYRKSPTNPYHTHQAGNFVHPTIEEATAELGHPPNAEQYLNWQEKFAIGRVRNVDKRPKGYAFTLEITDPEAKNILKSDAYRTGIPGWTSPQIISNANLFPEEERTGLYNHWAISHVALVDVPAYGYEQAGVRGKCVGAEKECTIKTRSASQENLGFCVRQATIDLINSISSQSSPDENSSHNTMSESTNVVSTTPKTGTNSDNVAMLKTATNAAPTVNTTIPTISDQPSPGQEKPEGQQDDGKPEEPQASVKSIEEANIQIKQMAELLKEQAKQLKLQGKELETIKQERKMARLSFIIPRDLFKSDESHRKEVERTMNENISEAWLTEYWKTKRELAMAQGVAKKMEEPLVAKSASLQQSQNGHDVPDFSSSQNTARTSNVQKQLELQRRILEGGGTY